jgi:hypothetical protein
MRALRDPHDLTRQLLAGQSLAVEGLRDRIDDGLQLARTDPVHLQPGRVPVELSGAVGGAPYRHLVRRHQVQRAAHRPDLDERFPLPQRVIDGPALHPIDAVPDRQAGGREHLRLHAANLLDGLHEPSRRGAPIQVMAGDPPAADLRPTQRSHRQR